MPAHVTLVANAFAGWPAIVLAWVLSMYFFSGVLSRSGAPFADKRAWAELSANFDFLFGVRVWLFACAASRGLLELYTCGMFSRMQVGAMRAKPKHAKSMHKSHGGDRRPPPEPDPHCGSTGPTSQPASQYLPRQARCQARLGRAQARQPLPCAPADCD